MKKLIALLAAGSLLAPTLATAGDGHGRHAKRWNPPPHAGAYYGGRHHDHYYRYDRYYYPKRRGGDNDDAAWAIGGLVLGAIIGSAAAKREGAMAPASHPLPPPQKRKVVTCYDEVAYDENGDPYVDRQCYEDWR